MIMTILDNNEKVGFFLIQNEKFIQKLEIML